MSDLTEFRKGKDDFFAGHPQSPLTAEQKRLFKGLIYFDEDEGLRMEVKAERFEDQQPVLMQTSTGSAQQYVRYGRFPFQVDGEEAELTIYQADYGFFLPFVDSLAGMETYPAGRYLEPEPLPGDRFFVDFNLAYNPYCAYNEMWSCPITPAENRLKVPVRAGEKLFHE